MSAIVDTELTHYTTAGARYRVWHDGEVLIESCREPLCSAARALVAKGVTGRLQMRKKGREQIAGGGLIAVLATMTVTEGQTTTPRFVKWSPHWATEDAA